MVNKNILAGIIASKTEKPPTRRDRARAMNLKLDPPEYKKLRDAAYIHDKKMKTILLEGLELWLEKNSPK